MDKRALILLGFLILVLIVAAYVKSGKPATSGELKRLRVGDNEYSVELADTLLSQARGLSGRERLLENHGMLFVFPSPSLQAFWMKDMQFPLDFIWINGGKVIGVTENVPVVPENNIQRPPSPADMVLEVSAGTVARDKIRIGDEVTLTYATSTE